MCHRAQVQGAGFCCDWLVSGAVCNRVAVWQCGSGGDGRVGRSGRFRVRFRVDDAAALALPCQPDRGCVIEEGSEARGGTRRGIIRHREDERASVTLYVSDGKSPPLSSAPIMHHRNCICASSAMKRPPIAAPLHGEKKSIPSQLTHTHPLSPPPDCISSVQRPPSSDRSSWSVALSTGLQRHHRGCLRGRTCRQARSLLVPQCPTLSAEAT